MIVLAGFALVVISVVLTGGSLAAIGQVRWRAPWLALGAIIVQTLLIQFGSRIGRTTGEVIHLATYAAAGLWFWLNRRVHGLALIGLGGGMNLIAIAANAGVMPASAWAVRTAGLDIDPAAFENSRALANPRLLIFGDILAIPEGIPLANVFSVGDVVLLAGAFVTLHAASRLAPAALDSVSVMVEVSPHATAEPSSLANGHGARGVRRRASTA